MNTPDVTRLRELAQIFRAALESAPRAELPITMQSFPHGACGDAALLLAKRLGEEGYGAFDYMLGERSGFSHAWLQQGDLIVDISGDQFDDMHEKVCVGFNSPWHAQFSAEPEQAADFQLYDDRTRLMLEAAYQNVMKYAPSGTFRAPNTTKLDG